MGRQYRSACQLWCWHQQERTFYNVSTGIIQVDQFTGLIKTGHLYRNWVHLNVEMVLWLKWRTGPQKTESDIGVLGRLSSVIVGVFLVLKYDIYSIIGQSSNLSEIFVPGTWMKKPFTNDNDFESVQVKCWRMISTIVMIDICVWSINLWH